MDLIRTPMDLQKHRFRWHIIFAIICIAAVLLLLSIWIFYMADQSGIAMKLKEVYPFLIYIALPLFCFASLLLAGDMVRMSHEHAAKLDNISEILMRQNNLLVQITQASHLSNAAREIIFRETDQMELGEAALSKLHQHDFEGAAAMIETMEQTPHYQQLGAKLRRAAEKYRTATEEGRISQVIAHIESLMDQHRWAQAAAQIQNLVKVYSYSDRVKTLSSRLQERKAMRKGDLLNEWDKAIDAKDPDCSLEILKELDQYLAPDEALTLQESAKKVFKAKLDNLGIQFKNAVTEKDWTMALEIGRQIVSGFPNSRMAAEIRSKYDILQEHARKTIGGKTAI
jgi:hypothetical protein